MDPTKMTSMSPLERRYFEQVGNECQAEVQKNCNGNSNNAVPLLGMPHPMLRASAHPLLQAHQESVMNDFGSVMEDMMRTVMSLPAFAETEEEAATIGMDKDDVSPVEQDDEEPRGLVEETPEEEEQPQGPVVIVRSFGLSDPSPCDHGDVMMRHMLSHFLPVVSPDETPLLAQKMADHGHSLLQHLDDGSDHMEARMARRLSEVTLEEVQQYRQTLFLPFSTEQNECLRRAYEARLVSAPCGQALQMLGRARAAQYQARVEQRVEEMSVFGNLLVLYVLVLATAVTLFWRRKTLFKVKRKLAHNIFSTIYSRPTIKQAVEDELGQSIGATPPMPRWNKTLAGLRRVRLATLLIFSVMSVLVLWDIVPVSDALQVCIVFAAVLFLRTLFWSPKAVGDCQCCCCAATPGDAKAGLLTDEQACCGCCQGTGVCCAACADCCGSSPDRRRRHRKQQVPSDDSGCCCCGAPCCADGCCGGAGGCCCCGNASPDKHELSFITATKTTKPAQFLYESTDMSDKTKVYKAFASSYRVVCWDDKYLHMAVKATDGGCCTNGCCGADCCANGCCGGDGGCCCGCCGNSSPDNQANFITATRYFKPSQFLYESPDDLDKTEVYKAFVSDYHVVRWDQHGLQMKARDGGRCANGCCGADCCANGCCGGAGGCCCCSNSSPDKKDAGTLTDGGCCGTGGCCGADCCANGCCGGAGGCCCCGGSSPGKKDAGTNTSGCCGSACCADGCCGGAGGCCCRCCCNSCPDKKSLKPRSEIYEGVPIQIV